MSEAAFFSRKLAALFLFFLLFKLNFILDPVPPRQKIYGSCGSGSTTLLRASVASYT
jgi:hypothetical protein